MGIKITSTGEASKYKKILVYGKSGIGKTRLCKTAKDVLIISSEGKFESLQDAEIDVWRVDTIKDFKKAIKDALGKKGNKYKCICIDSISDIHEVAIAHEKPNHNDPRRAYGVIQDKIIDILKSIRDSDKKHFYVIAKADMIQNDDNMDQYQPKMPGTKVGPELPYIFDYVFALKRSGDDDDEDGYVYLQTSIGQDIKWTAKDSSGKLEPMEEPNLTKLFKKLGSK